MGLNVSATVAAIVKLIGSVIWIYEFIKDLISNGEKEKEEIGVNSGESGGMEMISVILKKNILFHHFGQTIIT